MDQHVVDQAKRKCELGEEDVVKRPCVKVSETPELAEDQQYESQSGYVNTVHTLPQKPLARGKPPVFALARAALAEATSYFKSHESGNYHKDHVTLGLLLDRFESPQKTGTAHVKFSARDYMDGSVIITTMTRDSDGNMTWESSQGDESKNYQYLKNAKESGHAIVVVIGRRKEDCPVVPPYPYNVCGHFMITDIWSEAKLNNEKVLVSYWMVRLEKVPTGEISWWAEGTADDSHMYAVGQVECPIYKCAHCNENSKQIFDNGWACLNHHCQAHFHFFELADDGTPQHALVSDDSLRYNFAFLHERSDPNQAIEQELIPLAPPVPEEGYDIVKGQGIICPKCHCCARRIYWDRWECEEPSCDYVLKRRPKLLELTDIQEETEDAKNGKNKADFNSDVVSKWCTKMSGYSIQVYILPDENGQIIGTVTVCQATKQICALPHGPNDMFMTMQKEDLRLARGPVRHAGLSTEVLCGHFSHNWGAPYRFGVPVPTTAFSDTPEYILRCVSQLSWAQNKAVAWIANEFEKRGLSYSTDSMTLKPQNFNELLSLGYLQDCSIKWHDDGEHQLSATVASLSLGSPSTMLFRPKRDTMIGRKMNNKKNTRAPVLTFPLYHGDICIMHGTDIHKYYEHQVTPDGKLRFGLTSRYIRPESLEDPQERQDAIVNGKIPPGFEALAYRGIDSASAGTGHDSLGPSPDRAAELGGHPDGTGGSDEPYNGNADGAAPAQEAPAQSQQGALTTAYSQDNVVVQTPTIITAPAVSAPTASVPAVGSAPVVVHALGAAQTECVGPIPPGFEHTLAILNEELQNVA